MTMGKGMIKVSVLAALLASAVGVAAYARGPGDMMGDMMGGEDGMGPMAAFDFAAVDADKDGKITEAEMQAWRAAEAAKIDADKDGKLSTDELTAMHMARMQERAADMAGRMVTALDSDGDGLLSAAEMAARPMPAMLFGKLDADGDGAVTEAEIAAARDRMAEMRDGEGRGPGRHGRGGHGWMFWNQ